MLNLSYSTINDKKNLNLIKKKKKKNVESDQNIQKKTDQNGQT
jgi:hypothetical protein